MMEPTGLPETPAGALALMLGGAGPIGLMAMALRDNEPAQRWVLEQATRLLIEHCGYYDGPDGDWIAEVVAPYSLIRLDAEDVARRLVAGALRAMGVECLV